VLPESVYVMIGAAPTSMRATVGSSISRGRSARVCATRSRASVAASMTSTSRLNSMTRIETESREKLWIAFTPGSETIASSSFSVTWVSTSEGLAPG
jgi:hypothetical protein